MFKKEDLKNGMRVETRDGEMMLYMDGFLYGFNGEGYVDVYDFIAYPNVFANGEGMADIMKIYDKPTDEFNMLASEEIGELLWDRNNMEENLYKQIKEAIETLKSLEENLKNYKEN